MNIRELSRDECLQILAEARLARLACAKGNQPYVVPVYIVFDHPPGDEPRLYGFTTPGQKVEWMRANPLVCVEVDDVTAYDEWVSVIAFGHYEELPDTVSHEFAGTRSPEEFQPGSDKRRETPELGDARLSAYKLLQARPVWWQPGCKAHVHLDPAERLARIYYQIRIDRIIGHRAIPALQRENPPHAPARKEGWLHKLRHLGRQQRR